MATSPVTPPPDPAPLFELAVAYWRSAALFAALELELFKAVDAQPRSAAAIAETLGVPPRGLALLLEALVPLGILGRTPKGDYAATPLALAWLQPGAPGNLTQPIRFNAQAYPAWGALAQAIRRDAPPQGHQHILGADAEATRTFVLAMHQRAMGAARALAMVLDLHDCQTLLDLGGGPGTYSRLLAERFPQLHCTVLDLPPIQAIARTLHGDSPAAERLTWLPGDLFGEPPTPLPGPDFDVVLLSGVAHRTTGDGTVALLRRAAGCLKPGGRLALCDLFVGGASAGPVLPELFSLHMLVTANAGASLRRDEIADQLAAAGLRLTDTRPLPPPLPHLLVLASKI